VIVGLNDQTQTFMLGTLIKRVESGHEYIIRWCDETESKQEEEHLFGAFTRCIQHRLDDLVLAMDNEECIYKPAQVTRISNIHQTLTVRFLDSKEDNR
jgi:hypothetical protein